MKAIKIISKIALEIKENYQSTEDYCGWAIVNSNLEVMQDGVAYCVDFSITGYRQVRSSLKVMKPQMVENKKKWFEAPVDSNTKSLIENAVSNLIVLRFDEIIENEIEEQQAQDERIESEISLQETYKSLCMTER